MVLDRFQARPALRRFSIPECWAGAGNEAILVSRGYLSSCSSSTPCFLLCPGLTQPVLYLVCCFNSVPGAVSRSILRFSDRPLFAWVTSRTRLCHIDDRPPKLHFENGRQSFHPIPCGSRDRPVGRKVIDEAKLCVDTALAKSSSCVFPRQVGQLYRFSDI